VQLTGAMTRDELERLAGDEPFIDRLSFSARPGLARELRVVLASPLAEGMRELFFPTTCTRSVNVGERHDPVLSQAQEILDTIATFPLRRLERLLAHDGVLRSAAWIASPACARLRDLWLDGMAVAAVIDELAARAPASIVALSLSKTDFDDRAASAFARAAVTGFRGLRRIDLVDTPIEPGGVATLLEASSLQDVVFHVDALQVHGMEHPRLEVTMPRGWRD
jgi:hypothetical protein